MKYVMVTLLIIASALGVVYTFDAVREAESQRVEPPKDNELRIVASNFQLDKEEYVVKQGEPVVITMINQSGYHEFQIMGFDFDIKADQPIETVFEEPGEYTIYCSVMCGPGHADMVSTLIVEPADGADEGAEEELDNEEAAEETEAAA